MTSVTAPERSPLLDAIEARSRQDFGQGDLRYFFAPGRVNLVGAHLDYSGGDVMPMSVDRGISLGVRLRDDGRIRLRSIDQEMVIDVEATDVGDKAQAQWGWGNYPLGIFRCFQREHGVELGFEAVYAGDLPVASGLSSSAAIEVVTAIAEPDTASFIAGRRDLMGSFLRKCDQVKFACHRPGGEDSRGLLTVATNFVQETADANARVARARATEVT